MSEGAKKGPEQRNGPTEGVVSRDLAALLDKVRWDYDGDDEATLSPLTTTDQYFRDFPWDGD